MIQAPLLIALAVGFPLGYVEAFSEARAQSKPAFVLLTMDNCEPCREAKTLEPTLRQHGSFAVVNVSRERLLGRKLLGKTTSVPQLLACQWDGKRWGMERIVGLPAIKEIANGMHSEQTGRRPDKQHPTSSKLMAVKVSALRPSPGTSSPFLNDLLSRNHRPTGETEVGSQGHYATHFINSEQRNKHGFQCAVYLSGGTAYLLNNPGTTLGHVAGAVPGSLRGGGFRCYVVDSRQWWDNEPLYLLDEWAAYLAGTQACAETGSSIDVDDISALEMMVYSFVLCYCAEGGDKTWLPATKHLVRILGNRTQDVCVDAYAADPTGYRSRCSPYIRALRDSPDAEQLRQYIRAVWGEEWTKNLLGF